MKKIDRRSFLTGSAAAAAALHEDVGHQAGSEVLVTNNDSSALLEALHLCGNGLGEHIAGWHDQHRIGIQTVTDNGLVEDDLRLYLANRTVVDLWWPRHRGSAEEAREQLREVLELTRECVVEICMKDLHTVCGQPHRITEWIAMAKELAQEYA